MPVFVFSSSEVKSLVSGGPVGDFGLRLGLSAAEMFMFGEEAWQCCLIELDLEDVEQESGIQVGKVDCRGLDVVLCSLLWVTLLRQGVAW